MFSKISYGNSGASLHLTLKSVLGNLCKKVRSFHKNSHQTDSLIVKNNLAVKETTV